MTTTRRTFPLRSTTRAVAAAAVLTAAVPAGAQAHVSLHPNALPEGSFVTIEVRVPNEEAHANVTSVRMQMPAGVLSALGAPPAGWSFRAKTKKLAKPIKTDDGTISTEVTEVDFTGGSTPPGQFANLTLALSLPDSAKQGDVLAFPTIQTYSDGKTVRWIGRSADDDAPAPTVDITAPGTTVLDVSGGDAGPPAKLPADLAGSSAATTTVVNKEHGKGLSIAAVILAVIAIGVGGAALAQRRRVAA
jgi:uncharacterized protein YcnI